MDSVPHIKRCTKCNNELPESDFYIKDKRTGRLYSWCKQCHCKITSPSTPEDRRKHSLRCMAWQNRNQDKVASYRARFNSRPETITKRQARDATRKSEKQGYRARNREKIKASNAKYREREAEKIKAYNAEYYDANKAAVTARIKRCNEANPVLYEQLHKAAKHRRKVRLVNQGPHEKFGDNEIFRRDGWICQLCGQAVDPALRYPNPMSKSLDHILPIAKGGGHTRANCQLAHLHCNSSKRDRI